MTWIIMIVIQNKIMCLYNNFARKPLWKYKKNINENKHSFYDKKNICTTCMCKMFDVKKCLSYSLSH